MVRFKTTGVSRRTPHHVFMPKARPGCLRWLTENGKGWFTYRFADDDEPTFNMGAPAIWFEFSDKKTAALFRLFWGDDL